MRTHDRGESGSEYFDPDKRNYASLSIKDLLEAREAYHVHLAHKKNVIATAIGRYYIRRKDVNFRNPNKSTDPKKLPRRTLGNSDVRKWSWSCVLVFVEQWLTQTDLKDTRGENVPRFLYLPDGRVIPTCVIYAPPDTTAVRPVERLSFPSKLIASRS